MGDDDAPVLTWRRREDRTNPARACLVPDPALAYGAEGSRNRLVRGDNVLALTALREELAGQVQCVYIDPPYNRGEDHDSYEDGLAHGRWLSEMEARLRLLRELLAPSGSLFLHLDDNELDYAKVLLDQLFGRGAFVARITVDARAPSAFSTVNRGVFKASEYILWYARDRAALREYPVRVARPFDAAYTRFLIDPDAPFEQWQLRPLREAYEERVSVKRRSPRALERFVVAHARHVCRLAPISDTRAGKATVSAKHASKANPGVVTRVERPGYSTQYVLSGNQLVFYDKNVTRIDGELRPSAPVTNVWTDIAWEGIAGEGGVRFKKGKKPERLLRRCLQLTTEPGDLVLDCFGGSGTTAAVAHKMGRSWVLVERGEQLDTHCLPRLRRVVDGEDRTGISTMEGWQGGGGFSASRVQQVPK